MELHLTAQEIDQIRSWLSPNNKVVLIAHANADGDAIGAVMGMYHLLQGHAIPILPTGCPYTFRWLPGTDHIVDAERQPKAAQEAMMEADVIVGLDFNEAGRINTCADWLLASKAKKLLIDHHISPDRMLFDIVVSHDISSTCELVYWFFHEIYGDSVLNREAARCLYTGICTDTGSFSYSCEDPSLYLATAALVGQQIEAAEIHNQIDNIFSVSRMRFHAFALSERFRIYEEEHFAYLYITLEEQRRFGITPPDMEGLVQYTMLLKDIELGALLRERADGTVKISLRSKHEIDVCQIAREHFGGGGHLRASGATVHASLTETVVKFERVARNVLSKQSKQ